MNYKFEFIPEFKKDLKALSKKYKSLKKDIEKLKEEIIENPNLGVNLGGGLRKIRINITSKNQGKRGGARIITHELVMKIEEEEEMSVLFISLYDKSEYDNVDLNIIREIIKEYRN